MFFYWQINWVSSFWKKNQLKWPSNRAEIVDAVIIPFPLLHCGIVLCFFYLDITTLHTQPLSAHSLLLFLCGLRVDNVSHVRSCVFLCSIFFCSSIFRKHHIFFCSVYYNCKYLNKILLIFSYDLFFLFSFVIFF